MSMRVRIGAEIRIDKGNVVAVNLSSYMTGVDTATKIWLELGAITTTLTNTYIFGKTPVALTGSAVKAAMSGTC